MSYGNLRSEIRKAVYSPGELGLIGPDHLPADIEDVLRVWMSTSINPLRDPNIPIVGEVLYTDTYSTWGAYAELERTIHKYSRDSYGWETKARRVVQAAMRARRRRIKKRQRTASRAEKTKARARAIKAAAEEIKASSLWRAGAEEGRRKIRVNAMLKTLALKDAASVVAVHIKNRAQAELEELLGVCTAASVQNLREVERYHAAASDADPAEYMQAVRPGWIAEKKDLCEKLDLAESAGHPK